MCQGWANLLRYNCIHYSRQVTGNENHFAIILSQFIISVFAQTVFYCKRYCMWYHSTTVILFLCLQDWLIYEDMVVQVNFLFYFGLTFDCLEHKLWQLIYLLNFTSLKEETSNKYDSKLLRQYPNNCQYPYHFRCKVLQEN